MANSDLCSIFLPKGEGVRAMCITGERKGYSSAYNLRDFLGLGRRYTSTSKGVRTICQNCANELERRISSQKEASAKIFKLLIKCGLVIFYIFIFGIITNYFYMLFNGSGK